MDTLLIPADDPTAVDRAVACLAEGEPVGLPTETVYGLAADALNPAAVARVFEAKERPFFDPLIVHLPGEDWLERLAVWPRDTAAREVVARLTARFWPGPLTILLPRRIEVVPDLVTAGSPLVALRWSAHPVFAAVATAFGKPLAAPSANRFGRISPTDGPHVYAELAGRIPLVIDAGPTALGLESTVVAPQDDGGLHVLRPGPVTAEMLAEIAPVRSVTRDHGTTAAASAPGQGASHYAPNLPLHLLLPPGSNLTPEAPVPGTGVIAWRRDRPPPLSRTAARTEFLSTAGDLRETAANLFAALRRLDATPGLSVLWAEPVPATGLGVAINERLQRAAAKR